MNDPLVCGTPETDFLRVCYFSENSSTAVYICCPILLKMIKNMKIKKTTTTTTTEKTIAVKTTYDTQILHMAFIL